MPGIRPGVTLHQPYFVLRRPAVTTFGADAGHDGAFHHIEQDGAARALVFIA